MSLGQKPVNRSTADFLIANYQEHLRRLSTLAHPDCDIRVVFVEGGENVGKSHLLRCVAPELQQCAKVVLLELNRRRDVPSPIEILDEIVAGIGFRNFPRFREESHLYLNRRLEAKVTNVTITGSNNSVQASALETDADKLMVARRMTDAFLDDLKLFSEEPLILGFDGYDATQMPLVDKWFGTSLVHGLCNLRHVRLIISGRELPEATIKGRVGNTRVFELALRGVMEEQEWIPIIRALRLRLPRKEPEFLQGVIWACEGAPGLIMTRLKTLPKELA